MLNGITTLQTNTTANGNAQLTSNRRGRYMTGIPNQFIGGVREGDTGTANNIKRWGAFDSSNGLFFERIGTDLGVVIRSGGVDTRIFPLTGPNIAVSDTNMHTYEIYWSNGTARFFQDRKLLHVYTATQGQLCQSIALKIGYQCVNINSSTSNCLLQFRGSAINRFGKGSAEPQFRNISGTETAVVLKSAPGRLHRVVVNTKGGLAGSLVIYDATSATNPIATIDTGNANSTTLEYSCDFDNGLTFTSNVTVGNITLVFD